VRPSRIMSTLVQENQNLPNMASVDLTDTDNSLLRTKEEVCGDRGIHSSKNEEQALLLGVQRISLPQPGYKSDERRSYERQPWFRTAQAFRNGIEGCISQLRRAGHLDRCLAHTCTALRLVKCRCGEGGMECWIGWGIIANNLATIAQFLIQHHRSVPLTTS
jgi:hypothetical protein